MDFLQALGSAEKQIAEDLKTEKHYKPEAYIERKLSTEPGTLVLDWEQAGSIAASLASLPNDARVCWDTETFGSNGEGLLKRKDGADWLGGGISLKWTGGPEGGVYIPVEVGIIPILEALMDTEATCVTWNSMYDIQVARRLLPRFDFRPQDRDAMILAFLADENLSRALKERGEIEFPEQGAKEEKKLLEDLAVEHGYVNGKVKEWWRMGAEHPELIYKYACQDAVLTDGLYKIFNNVNRIQPAIQREHDLLPVLDRMQERGVNIDWDFVETSVEEAIYEMQMRQDSLPEDLNPRSPKQLQKLFYEGDNPEPVYLKTKTGAPSCSGEALALMTHPLAKTLHEIKQYDSVRRFAQDLLSNRGGDDRVHPGINFWAQVTGRASVTGPAITLAPAKGKLPIEIRDAIIPTPGFELVRFDVNREEVFLAADFSGDVDLKAALLNADDFYAFLAAEMLGLGNEEDVSKVQRGATKVTALAAAYGTGVATLSITMSKRLGGVPSDWEDLAADTLSKHKDRFQGFWNWFYRILQESKANEGRREQEFWPGRWRQLPYPGSGGQKHYAMPNWIIQGASAEVLKDVLIQGFDRFEDIGAHVVIPLHDELWIEVEPGSSDESLRLLQEITDDVSPLKGDLRLTWSAK